MEKNVDVDTSIEIRIPGERNVLATGGARETVGADPEG